MADAVKRYIAKNYSHLLGIGCLTQEVVDSHIKLYEGYVKRANALTEKLEGMAKEKKAAGTDPVYAELTRRLGWEYNGVVLHELYFGNLTLKQNAPQPSGKLKDEIVKSFGDVETWFADFRAVSTMPGIGWAILYQDPSTGWLSNHWITEHQNGHPAGFAPIVVLDAWEHAFVPKYKPTERAKYVEDLLSYLDWSVIEQRLVHSLGKR